MAGGVSAPDRDRSTQRFGDIIVVGGGCYGRYYVRQLERARDAGAVEWERLLVVDRDPGCAVARQISPSQGPPQASPATELICLEWELFFHQYLGAAAQPDAGGVSRSGRPHAVVPSPLMPHLMARWLVSRARARWPGRAMRLAPLEGALDVPWQRPGDDGTHYASFATWECPINCIEPARCPHTRGARAWSLPPTITAFVETARLRGRRIDGPALFHCVHRAYGVGMFDVESVLMADRLVATAAQGRAAEILIGTVSHCHGALTLLAVAGPE